MVIIYFSFKVFPSPSFSDDDIHYAKSRVERCNRHLFNELLKVYRLFIIFLSILLAWCT